MMDALCLDFLNSDWHDYRGSGAREEYLERQDWVAGFLARWHLPPLDPPDAPVRERLVTFRGQLRALLECASAGTTLDEQGLAPLNQALSAAPLRRRAVLGAAGL